MNEKSLNERIDALYELVDNLSQVQSGVMIRLPNSLQIKLETANVLAKSNLELAKLLSAIDTSLHLNDVNVSNCHTGIHIVTTEEQSI